MTRSLQVAAFALLVAFTAAAFAEKPADPNTGGPAKTGAIKSVDAKAKSFVCDLPARPLTIVVKETTKITLDGKESTFDDAIKAGNKATVTYSKVGEDRVASKVEVTAAPATDKPAEKK